MKFLIGLITSIVPISVLAQEIDSLKTVKLSEVVVEAQMQKTSAQSSVITPTMRQKSSAQNAIDLLCKIAMPEKYNT